MEPSERIEASQRFLEFVRNSGAQFNRSLHEIAPANPLARREWLMLVMQYLINDTAINPLTAIPEKSIRQRVNESALPNERREELLALLDEHFTAIQQAANEFASSDLERLPNIPGIIPIKQLGMGGGGIVYEAVKLDGVIEQRIAVKVLRIQFPDQSEQAASKTLRRFRREYEVLKSLHHSNIVSVEDFGNDDSYFYYTMPVFSGGTLRERIPVLSLQPWDKLAVEFMRLMSAICDAVHAAHQRGIIHRDLKPANILFDKDNNPHVGDFGIARVLSDDTIGYEAGILGTPRFAAPETFQDPLSADQRSDIFSLGVLMKCIVHGDRELGSEAYKHRTAELPIALQHILDRCTEPLPDRRYQSVMQLIEALGSVNGDNATGQSTARGSKNRASENYIRNILVYVGLATAVILLLGVGAIMLSRRSGEQPSQVSLSAPAASNVRSVAEITEQLGTLQAQIDSMHHPYNDLTAAQRHAMKDQLRDLDTYLTSLTNVDPWQSCLHARALRMSAELDLIDEVPTETVSEALNAARSMLSDKSLQQQPADDFVLEYNQQLYLQWKLAVDQTSEDAEDFLNKLRLVMAQQDWQLSSADSIRFAVRVRHQLADLAANSHDYASSIEELACVYDLLDAGRNVTSQSLTHELLATLMPEAIYHYREGSQARCVETLDKIDAITAEAVVKQALAESDFDSNGMVDYFASFAENMRGAIHLRRYDFSGDREGELKNAERLFISAIARRQRLVDTREYHDLLFKNLVDSLANLSTVYRHSQNWERAIKICEDQHALLYNRWHKTPTNEKYLADLLHARYRLAQVTLEMGNSDRAVTLANESIDMLASSSESFRNYFGAKAANHYALRAEVLMAQQKYADAIADWDVAVATGATSLQSRYRVARSICCVEMRRFADALSDLDSLAAMELSQDALYNVGQVYSGCAVDDPTLSETQLEELVRKVHGIASRLLNQQDRDAFYASDTMAQLSNKLGARFEELRVP